MLGDDLDEAEREAETARGCVNMLSNAREGIFTDEERAERAARLDAAEKRLAAIRAGEIPAFTEAQKKARHAARRREIVAAYRARLAAAGMDASWVDLDGAGGWYACEKEAA